MNDLEKTGRTKTILLSISILLISVHTIYYYHSAMPEFEIKKLIQQIIRFTLTSALLYQAFLGKKWAKNISIILFSIAALGAIFALFTIDIPLILKTPFIVMIIIYCLAIYHFAFSTSFKAFSEFQNKEKSPSQLKTSQ